MNQRLHALNVRRALLISAAAQQRQAVTRHIAPWRAPLALADQGLQLVRVVRQHPQWWVGALLLIAALQPRRVARWLQRGWLGWQLLGQVRGALEATPRDQR